MRDLFGSIKTSNSK